MWESVYGMENDLYMRPNAGEMNMVMIMHAMQCMQQKYPLERKVR